jgi:threonine dehydrogenase-like Zn-dependent dehydrogenase
MASRPPEDLPETQYAVQLIGPGKLHLNTRKEVHRPGPHQFLARVEAVGLCFSDLKLLKQFSNHPRKGEVVGGLARDVLESLPSYVPGEKPTVPGHEVVCRIVSVGEGVEHHRAGERVIVQADYRQLPTAGSNAAFGYNFEGALQEYVLMDERVVVDGRSGQRFLIPVSSDLGASAVCLVEPWACVENSYATRERQRVKAGGNLLVVVDGGRSVRGLAESFSADGAPGRIAALCDPGQLRQLEALGAPVDRADDPARLDDEAFDDIVYFGADASMLEALNDKLAAGGILNVVRGASRIGRRVSVGVGRRHYGATRWIGTATDDASDAYGAIPATGEIRAGDRVAVVGAGGPMGQMHVIRAVCCGLEGISVTAADVDDARLESLRRKAAPVARRRGVPLRLVNTHKQPLAGPFSYWALMAPLGRLVADAIDAASEGGLINVFAGIPAATRHEIDLDACIEKRCFLFGTSGSRIEDMHTVLDKVTAGSLDTNFSVDAVSGMAGAADGIAAVENRTMAGKIIVYPALHETHLIPLSEMAARLPSVAERLDHGTWTRAAEQELLAVAK